MKKVKKNMAVIPMPSQPAAPGFRPPLRGTDLIESLVALELRKLQEKRKPLVAAKEKAQEEFDEALKRFATQVVGPDGEFVSVDYHDWEKSEVIIHVKANAEIIQLAGERDLANRAVPAELGSWEIKRLREGFRDQLKSARMKAVLDTPGAVEVLEKVSENLKNTGSITI